MLYHLLGTLSACAFLLTWYGLAHQWLVIERKKREIGKATASLSTNQFASSFFAFYANFIFGIAISPFNHYLVWTRLGALILILLILFRIWQDRHNRIVKWVFITALCALVLGLSSILFRPYEGIAQLGANGLMLVVTAILVQGTLHQWLTLRRAKSVGTLSSQLFRSILIKDLTTLAFALTMPISIAWPLLVLNGASVVTRGALLIQMEIMKREPQ